MSRTIAIVVLLIAVIVALIVYFGDDSVKSDPIEQDGEVLLTGV